jgi:hypothetical protein
VYSDDGNSLVEWHAVIYEVNPEGQDLEIHLEVHKCSEADYAQFYDPI